MFGGDVVDYWWVSVDPSNCHLTSKQYATAVSIWPRRIGLSHFYNFKFLPRHNFAVELKNVNMKPTTQFLYHLAALLIFSTVCLTLPSCGQATNSSPQKETTTKSATPKPEYFSLRPEVEKGFGYSHAVKIGNIIKVSGAVSMDDQGNPSAIGDMGQQMKNCYASLEKILQHYGCTFDDVVVENVFTTDMPRFLENASYRRTIYTKQFPTGTWVGVKELALPVFLIEIELEVYKAD